MGKCITLNTSLGETRPRVALARRQLVFERGPGVAKIAPPESARDGHGQDAGHDRGRRRWSADEPGRGDNERFTERDDDDQAVALREMIRMEIPSFELPTDAGGHEIQGDCSAPPQVLSAPANERPGQDGG